MDEKETLWERHGVALLLFLCFVIGCFFVGLFEDRGAFPFKFGEHLAMATAIAGLIGLLVDWALKKELSKNVFKAAIGYLLPEEIRGELRWVYGQSFICKDHTQTVHVTWLKAERLVTLRCEITRELQNVTSETRKFRPGIGVEENFHPGRPTKIISYTYQMEGEQKSKNFAENLVVSPKMMGIALNTDDSVNPEVAVKHGAKFRVCFEYEKTLNETDSEYLHFGTATSNVTVIVYAPNEFLANVHFSHRDNDPSIVKTGPHTWKLHGVLLPLQGIRIHWTQREVYETWEKIALK